MEIKHFTHQHTLTSRVPSDQAADSHGNPPRCNGCGSYIRGLAYFCEDCNFWLHKSCSELPREKKHPCHSAHSLRIHYYRIDDENVFVCDGCQELCFGLKYFCKWCRVFFGTNCACSTYEEADTSVGAQTKTTVLHFSHRDQLTWCKVRQEPSIPCLACKEVILGAAYICIPCTFIIHESCLSNIPQEVKHPFHPQHHLLPQPVQRSVSYNKCNACHEIVQGICFSCEDCSFYLHVSCAKYQTRAIKNQFHKHDLLYFGPKNIGRCRKCHSCGEDCCASFFCCVECQVDIHLECLPLPLLVKHNLHFHPLTLRDFIVDDLGQNFCDMCEKERNPEHHVYYCEDCNYTAHIDCVISQVQPPLEILSYLVPLIKKVELHDENNDVKDYNAVEKESNLEEATSDLELRDAKLLKAIEKLVPTKVLKKEMKNLQKEVEDLTAKLAVVQVKLKKLLPPSSLLPSPKTAKRIQHFSHKHTLVFCGLSDKRTCDCMGCGYQIRGPAFACENEFCNFQFHKCCSELPKEIEKHPLHPAHPLLLIQNYEYEEYLICDGCRELSRGQKYSCKWCKFTLDIRCAFEEVVPLKGDGHVENTISHLSHEHDLTRCSMTDEFKETCYGCKEDILGPIYACFDCQFYLHESCLNDMPQQVETPFHPQHHLLPRTLNTFDVETCKGCHKQIKFISFNCKECSFYLHASCAKYKTRAIKHEFHEHDMLYFGQRNIGRHPICCSCDEDCSGSFFSCVGCDVDIHLECLPLPLLVKHSRHLVHPLTLTDSSVVEDDLGEYYCDFCETERNPKDHVYYCQECNIIAHIDCVISQVEPPEEILSYLVSRTMKVASDYENDETRSETSDSDPEKGINTEELVCCEQEEGIQNLQEEEEGLIGSLELAQARLKKRKQKLVDLLSVF